MRWYKPKKDASEFRIFLGTCSFGRPQNIVIFHCRSDVSPDVDPADLYRFFEVLGEGFLVAAQWGRIPKACGVMLDPSRTPLENLPHVGERVYSRKHLMELLTGGKRFDREVCKFLLPAYVSFFSCFFKRVLTKNHFTLNFDKRCQCL